MSKRLNKRRYLLRKNQYETDKSSYAISSNNEFLFKFYDIGQLGYESKITTELSIDEQLENMSEMETLIYEDQINKEIFKFGRKK